MNPRQPNILLVVLHDLGTHLGCYGRQGVQSPHIDALARDGVRFTHNFATATFCSPSRGAIITGRWPHCNGLMGLVNLGWDLPEGNETLGRLLGQNGYETYLFGLQHEVKRVERLGFQNVPQVSSRHCRDVAPAVAEFLAQRDRSSPKPFYARVGFIEVHRLGPSYAEYASPESEGADDAPGTAVPAYLESTAGARLDFSQFHACICHTDAHIGAILKALRENGLEENTLVVFTTDHGIDSPGAKGTLYDAGINTALIARWPAGLTGGQTRPELISNIDLLPTLLQAAGVDVPKRVQGRSFLPLLRGGPYVPNSLIFAEKNTSAPDIKRCVRTGRWKYIRNFNEGPVLLLGTCTEYSLTRRDMGDAHLRPRPGAELYDLEHDRYEQHNLAGHADWAQIESELAADLQSWMQRTEDPLLKGAVPRPPEEAELRRRAWESIRRQTGQ